VGGIESICWLETCDKRPSLTEAAGSKVATSVPEWNANAMSVAF